MGRRTLALVAALVIAAAGTVLVFLYVNGVDARALADQEPVKVLVASSDIDPGTPARQVFAAADLQTIPSGSAQDGALSDLDGQNGQVTVAKIFKGQQIISSQFGSTGSVSSIDLPSDKLGVSVKVNGDTWIPGLINVGADVSVFYTGPGGRNGADHTILLLANAKILAIGGATAGDDGGDSGTDQNGGDVLVTFAADQSEAQKLIFASRNGNLSLVPHGKSASLIPDAGAGADNLGTP